MSLVEALANVVIGYVLAVATQLVVFPVFGVSVSTADSMVIAAIFTTSSIARSYALRRLFEWLRLHGPERGTAARGSGGGPVVSMSPGNRQPAIR